MLHPTPWKRSVLATVCLAAGLKLLLASWTLAGVSAFVALLLVALGALRLVNTPSFDGLGGAVAVLAAGGDVAVGAVVLAWPAVTLFILATALGAWVAIRSVAAATIIVATRSTYPAWIVALAVTVAELALAIVLIARPSGDVSGAALTVGAIAALEGALELGGAIARHHRDRALQRIARKAPAGSPVDRSPEGVRPGTLL
jgi:uncharacterized membrane protein HdeD (DUF308 family)